MKAVVCRQHDLVVDDLAEPRPGEGQLVIEVHRCGICGSDLHARTHSDELADVLAEIGYDDSNAPRTQSSSDTSSSEKSLSTDPVPEASSRSAPRSSRFPWSATRE